MRPSRQTWVDLSQHAKLTTYLPLRDWSMTCGATIAVSVGPQRFNDPDWLLIRSRSK